MLAVATISDSCCLLLTFSYFTCELNNYLRLRDLKLTGYSWSICSHRYQIMYDKIKKTAEEVESQFLDELSGTGNRRDASGLFRIQIISFQDCLLRNDGDGICFWYYITYYIYADIFNFLMFNNKQAKWSWFESQTSKAL